MKRHRFCNFYIDTARNALRIPGLSPDDGPGHQRGGRRVLLDFPGPAWAAVFGRR